LIASTGWRFSYLMMGIAVLVLALPALSFLRPAKDSDSETRRNGAKIEQRETNILPEASQGMAAIIRKRPFWAVMGSHATDCLCHSVILVHLVPFAIESGVPKIQAASLMSALGMGALVGRTAGGMLSDRIGPKWALFISLTLQTIPIPLLLMSPSLPVLYLIATLVGLGLGGHGTMYPVITREFYGPKRVGILFGTFTAGASAGMASGSFLGGVFHDLAGNYIPAFVFSLTMGVISLILVWLYPKGRTMSRFSALSASKPLA
jgi:predicted MFS family arabinose efflux permease